MRPFVFLVIVLSFLCSFLATESQAASIAGHRLISEKDLQTHRLLVDEKDEMTANESSLEFLIAKATDPFLEEESSRSEYVSKICSGLEEDFDGPFVAMKLLSYKMLSPNQQETMDAVLRRGGLRCANELGKFKFLNQFIRLLSPKYQGNMTSERVKRKTITLLYTWKQSFRHLEKLSQVYGALKDQKIIDDDPEVEENEIPKLSTREKRMCSMEDEEKAKLLSKLLYSKNPEDLQVD